MRAMLWLKQESHWNLTSYDDNCCRFDFSLPVQFVFIIFGANLSQQVSMVTCEAERRTLPDGRQEDLNVISFYEKRDSSSEEGFGFQFPANCVWVAGEVEL